MKINYECGACFLRQAKEAMDLASDDEELKNVNISFISSILRSSSSLAKSIASFACLKKHAPHS